MGLSKDDMRPLLELLRHEIAHWQHGAGLCAREFPLVEVSLEGNPLVELEYQAAITQGLRQLVVLQLGADLKAQPGGMTAKHYKLMATRQGDFLGSDFPSSMAGLHGQLPKATDVGARPGSPGTAGMHGSKRSSSSKSLPPHFREEDEDDGGQALERNAVSEGDADSDQDIHHSLELILSSTGAGSTATRGGSIPVSAMPDRGSNRGLTVPDRGLECGFGPAPNARVFQGLAHLDPSDTDSEGAVLSARHLAAAAEEEEEEEQQQQQPQLAASNAQCGWRSGEAEDEEVEPASAREPDPHERLDAVSERLRDGDIQPGHHVLRWALDRISSDVSSSAEPGQEPPPANRSEVELEGVCGDPLLQPGGTEELRPLQAWQGFEGAPSEGSGTPWEAAAAERPMKRSQSAW